MQTKRILIQYTDPTQTFSSAVGYMFTHKTDCCEKHYSYNYDDCVGISTSAYSNLYYPDWEADHICKTGGTQPLVGYWKFVTCCSHSIP